MTEHLAIEGPDATAIVLADDGTELIIREVIDQDCYRLGRYVQDRHLIDVGANVGVVTLAALTFGASRVTAIEPDAVNANLLRHNAQLNSELADGRVVRHVMAVGVGDEQRVVRRAPDHPDGCYGSSFTVPAWHEPDAKSVEAHPLGWFLPAGDDDLVLKVDAEGAEYDVITGATEAELARCAVIVMEWHHFPAREANAYARFPGLLRKVQASHDFEVYGALHVGGMLYAHRR